MKTDGNMYDSHPARKLLLEVILLFAVIGIFFSGSVSAAEKQGPVSRWVSKGGYCYFYDKEGKMLTGLQTIGKRQYLFDRD